MEIKRDVIDVRRPIVKAAAQREYKLLQLGWKEPGFLTKRFIYTPEGNDFLSLIGIKQISNSTIERVHEDFSVDIHFVLPNAAVPSGRALHADPIQLEPQGE